MRTSRSVIDKFNSESEEKKYENDENEAQELDFKNSRVNFRAQ